MIVGAKTLSLLKREQGEGHEKREGAGRVEGKRSEADRAKWTKG